jgi:spermidine synthase
MTAVHSTETTPGGTATVAFAAAIVFLSSAFIMTLELVAARLVAQHLGVSLYTWTAVIGVILAGITVGNYVGGKLADIYEARGLLTSLFFASSIASLSILLLVEWMGSWDRPDYMTWPLWILWTVAITFFAPATLLGTISPAAARLALTSGGQIGSTVGSVYAAGAAGSIVGTFLTGYVLVGFLGTKTVIVGIAAGLALLSLVLGLGLRRSPTGFLLGWLGWVVLVGSAATAPWEWAVHWGHFFGLRFDTSEYHFQEESSYFGIQVYDAEEMDNTRILALDHLVHSYVTLDDPTHMVYAYETVYAALTDALAPRDGAWNAFFIGGGGYTFPRYLETLYPDAGIDVSEIDPMVTEAAHAALGLPRDTGIRSWHMDARNFVSDRAERIEKGAAERYHFIFGDAFNDLSVPYHLTTRGFNDQIAQIMAPDGVYMMNVIDIYRDGFGGFLSAVTATLTQTFANVYVFSGEAEGTSDERDTFVVIGSQRPILDVLQRAARGDAEGTLFAWAEQGRYGGDMRTLLARGSHLVLTDSHAPVDNLLAPVFAAQ